MNPDSSQNVELPRVSKKYFIGNCKDPNTVTQSPAVSFTDFVNRYIDNPPIMEVDKSLFLSMDEQSQRKSICSYFITPATFDKNSCERITKNSVGCNLIIVVIESHKDVRRMLKKDGKFFNGLKRWSFCAYRSPFSTKLAPQIIVAINCHAIPLERYPHAVKMMAKRLRLTSLRPQCFNPLAVFPLPVLFRRPTI